MSKSTYKSLRYQNDDGLVTITLDRPDAANGLNVELADELAKAAQQACVEANVKVVILTGAGGMFCAGGDINAMANFGEHVATGLKGIANSLHAAVSTFARMKAPLIVAVNGTAAGAGLVLAACGDLVVASRKAKFTAAYTKIGLSPDGGSTYYLPRLIGLRKTQELIFTNRVLSAEEALDWGLVTSVVDAEMVMDEAKLLAEQFMVGASGANSAVKSLLLQTWINGPETQMELEGQLISANAASADGKEGLAAFLEKRKPNFK
jgi:2-(1,2-epoxy-1,2-dihydrophenyl)acetyl-CoA isomerase